MNSLRREKEWAEDLGKGQLGNGGVNEEHLGAPVGPPDSYRVLNIRRWICSCTQGCWAVSEAGLITTLTWLLLLSVSFCRVTPCHLIQKATDAALDAGPPKAVHS